VSGISCSNCPFKVGIIRTPSKLEIKPVFIEAKIKRFSCPELIDLDYSGCG
jgi:hypothetical protein